MKIVEKWYKTSNPNVLTFDKEQRQPAQVYVEGKVVKKRLVPKTVKKATIYKDPSLKKHASIHRAVVAHEKREARNLAKGMTQMQAHRLASKKDSKVIRGLSLEQIWWKLGWKKK